MERKLRVFRVGRRSTFGGARPAPTHHAC